MKRGKSVDFTGYWQRHIVEEPITPYRWPVPEVMQLSTATPLTSRESVKSWL